MVTQYGTDHIISQAIGSGYLHSAYLHSFDTLFEGITLPYSGLRFLKRELCDGYYDLTGPYPFVSITDGGAFIRDIEHLRNSKVVSLVCVVSPFTSKTVQQELGQLDLFKPFKMHYVSDLSGNWRNFIRPRFKSYINQAMRRHEVRLFPANPEYTSTFWSLYSTLIKRHQIQGIQRLSEAVIEAHLSVSGAVVTEARDEQGVAGAAIWYQCGPHGYLHLHAQAPRAYAQRTSYALYAAALDYFTGKVTWLDYGGAAGLSDDSGSGLAQFKKGWSTQTQPSFLCGAILNHDVYTKLVADTDSFDSAYFPAYRDPAIINPKSG